MYLKKYEDLIPKEIAETIVRVRAPFSRAAPAARRSRACATAAVCRVMRRCPRAQSSAGTSEYATTRYVTTRHIIRCGGTLRTAHATRPGRAHGARPPELNFISKLAPASHDQDHRPAYACPSVDGARRRAICLNNP
ncbi:hypothetical protein EVAR_85086_1 [Eumeta japonica]|uniref:Uncharacterized protein n=1 Tax=Eumeta variegata TaxID=151549 RepID=A0A4C1XF53_EUMVA|nr:hypothetical protein EVAR_85086_1 [Eumeta japonica]